MHFRLLGPIEIVYNDRLIHLGGINQRATLAYLLLHANNVVPTSKLLQALWGQEPPATSRKMVHNAIASLRRTLAVEEHTDPGAAVLTRPPGYSLRVDPMRIDLFQFRRLVAHAQAELTAGSVESAVAGLRQALALWRGPAVTDLVEAGYVWHELAALQSERLTAFENCMDAALSLGQHYRIVDELEAMAYLEPTRERLCGLLMQAMHRCDRQADALEAYRRTRCALIEQFGLEPSARLQNIQQAILQQDLPTVPGVASPRPFHDRPLPYVRGTRRRDARSGEPTPVHLV